MAFRFQNMEAHPAWLLHFWIKYFMGAYFFIGNDKDIGGIIAGSVLKSEATLQFLFS
jgi:hypothetical protein